MPAGAGDIHAAIADVRARIATACLRVGRDPASVDIVAVTKSVALSQVAEAVANGLTVLGENRVQEAATKAPALPGVEWHLLGRLQSNKAARAVALFDVVESVDSVDLARRLARLAANAGKADYPIYLQVNVDRDPGKAGFAPEALEHELPEILGRGGVEVRGLMTVGRLVGRPDDARSTFVRLRELSEHLRRVDDRVGPQLSMGMSDDFEVAVEEGATLVRLGRVIFGARPVA